ncbi:MAG: gliding motility-associated C-terminal domain-containing protein [Bacteroidota bacterium]|nr:gliding motility-associated C-terminal domain-containing protein [Bacteroidota bacterium]MDP4217517.1 gliding motility-associated C-terminal domain-containing protein [Bacteroidota bacterium]MDP4246986.1 gliding motility-associated C-terminal domain-containing protein [Bacteroidota bacterium]MDP4255826.1 gliding motility-associated C-terminal domain-containing protein [Bacteroidota bacterium]MDP4260572.1 gliding motility-associated C-terminal domain-containing protein [Bacteroidota bacterium
MPVQTYKYGMLVCACVIYLTGNAQITVPWSASLNVNFGRGPMNPGPPLAVGKTDFTYTPESCPAKGSYTVVNSIDCRYDLDPKIDATITYNGIFQNAFPESDSGGYMMLVNAGVSADSMVVFQDTVKNLCSHSGYLFWAGITNLDYNACAHENFTMRIETMTGQVIETFQTGDLSQFALDTNHFAYYVGYTSLLIPAPRSSFPFFYGSFFTLPAGVTDVVAKIILDPLKNVYPDCTVHFALDNILITPVSSQLHIENPVFPQGWVIGACFQGDKPVILNGSINYDPLTFGLTRFAGTPYTTPAFQWQQSLDKGYTWTDIAGETNLHFSRSFNNPDTFLIRLRGSDASDINNVNCSVTSNVIKAQVDGMPKDFSFTSNSPVCEDTDLVFRLHGGASYTIAGPNGYSDNTAFPHIYHPGLADSGWYYANIISPGGCRIEDSTRVIIVGPAVKIGKADPVCYGIPVQLSASGGVKYSWSPRVGLSASELPNPVAKPPATTTYSVQVTDNSGCSAFAKETVTIIDTFFKARISAPRYACPRDIIEIKDSSEGKIASWQWDLGDGQTYHSPDPPKQKFPAGNHLVEQYRIKLTVTDTAGCTDSAAAMISAVPNCFIAVPSAFTPNGDGRNDYLFPLNAYKATHLTFRVFNRSGLLLFLGRSINDKWDGTYGGALQPAGTYLWTLDYDDDKNEHNSLNGTAVLIR